jgi:site-specific DNA-methyltransferase (adenine-specific)
MMEEVRQKKIKVEIHNDNYTIYNGSMLDMLEVIQPNSIDSIVCDPPYELNFMNKGWDNGGISFNPDTWKKCYEVLKPGGYLLAFGGSRTFHRIAVAIEDAGFEIRDTIMWLYGSGFPKSMNIGLAIDKKKGIKSEIIASYERYNEPSGIVNIGQGERKKVIHKVKKASNEWQGWGTALKPAYEPIIVARKPLSGTVVDNVLTYGVGGINIDECRVGETGGVKKINIEPNSGSKNSGFGCNGQLEELNDGRFPANVIHDGSDEALESMPTTGSGNGGKPYNYAGKEYNNKDTSMFNGDRPQANSNYNDNGSAGRYFYTAKVSKKDRDEGLEFAGFEEQKTTDGNIRSNQETARIFGANSALRKNIHPTVKPCELMQYLIRLVTPKGGIILDPFMGSGSTGKAVMFENRERNANYKFIGIDLEEKYCQIASARIDYALNKFEYDYIKEKQEAEARGQANIFDFIEAN